MRGGRSLVRDFSLVLGGGEALVLTGPNGVGKTSLLRLMAGLLAPADGTIRFDAEPGRTDRTLSEDCHFVGAQDALTPELSVIEHIRFWARLLGDDTGSEAAAFSILDALGIGHLETMPAGYLSSGQRRRLSLARLLAVPRPLWLLDEPTNALDTAGRERLRILIARHRALGGMVVAATHDPLELPDAMELDLISMAGVR
ncbi:cytochrome c biogenesis ATP-binding export protein CcmA [Agaricicola taiwanensis]|uniref:Cytochrome c biogenesis ATP-binding export protein CcmA n=2 Tax=Agaricicola taiwanensis TaxID=591372 RepID=A0A8J3DU97_9RHOB|nr:cytochrome c biogenesis ATP-binding export protein CcmA [Agaricicola taiwanensis]